VLSFNGVEVNVGYLFCRFADSGHDQVEAFESVFLGGPARRFVRSLRGVGASSEFHPREYSPTAS